MSGSSGSHSLIHQLTNSLSMLPNATSEEHIEDLAGGEFEREPVPKSKWKGWGSFLGMYAGEHAAGTEFMIGPLFLTAGVSAFDLLFGLLVGNLLAVLSWRFLTAEIAVKNRLTLYFQLEKISGSTLVKFYNVANGVLFCFLAGSMITVSATAIGVPLNMEMPTLTDTLPNGPTYIIIVLIVGAVIALIASRGYDTVSKAANWMSPVIVLAFLACGIVALGQLGVGSFQEFWDIWGEGSEPFPGQIKYTFWHVAIWSWFANAAMHIGMSDLSVFRFAKKASSGWTTAAGMYVGHYMAWIAAALLYAVYLQTPEAQTMLAGGEAPPVAPGPLAFQTLMPKVSTFWVTILAGTIATIAGLFPAFAMKLLGFVAFYGFVLAPFGAVIVFEHFFHKSAGIQKNYAEIAGIKFNPAVLCAWAASFGLFYFLSWQFDIFLSFVTLPAWLLCGVLFLVFSRQWQKHAAE